MDLFGARVGRNNPFDDDFGAGRNGQVAQFGFYQFHGFLHERARFFVLAAVARQPRDGSHHDAGVVADHDRHGHVLTLVLVFLVDVRPVVPFDEPDTELMGSLTLVAIEPDVCDARVRVAAHEKGAGQVGPGIEGVVRGNRQHVERGVRPLEHDVLNRRGGGIDHHRADRCRLPFAVEPDHLRDRRAEAQREPFVRRGQIDHGRQARVAHLREE